MSLFQSENTPPLPPPPPSPSPPLSNGKTSPAILFIVVILAVMFFISGLLHLLARFITRHRSSSSDSLSDPHQEMSNSETFERQLQQLFTLHDSGLDQAFIDALPVFQYKEIMGLKELFDCAVCLSQFSEQDRLRLLPLCSHAFHVDCIDTWLLSNSTCPLCRGALYTPGITSENPVFDFEDWREDDCGGGGLSSNVGESGRIAIVGQKANEVETVGEKKMVLSVRLGKFKSSNNEGQGGVRTDARGGGAGETSSSNLDARRCFSMGSYQYVVANSELQVALSSNRTANGADPRAAKERVGQWQNENSSLFDTDVKGKRINMASKNESFSVSKIWLWSKKGKIPGSSPNTHIGDHPSADMKYPWSNIA